MQHIQTLQLNKIREDQIHIVMQRVWDEKQQIKTTTQNEDEKRCYSNIECAQVLKSDLKKLVCNYYITTHRSCQAAVWKVPAYKCCSKQKNQNECVWLTCCWLNFGLGIRCRCFCPSRSVQEFSCSRESAQISSEVLPHAGFELESQQRTAKAFTRRTRFICSHKKVSWSVWAELCWTFAMCKLSEDFVPLLRSGHWAGDQTLHEEKVMTLLGPDQYDYNTSSLPQPVLWSGSWFNNADSWFQYVGTS